MSGDALDREEEQRRDQKRKVWRTLDLIHDGRTFLRRRGLDAWKPFGIVVHILDGPDPGMDLHDHPWPFVSLILRGGYSEEVMEARHACIAATLAGCYPDTCTPGVHRSWSRWSVHQMPLNLTHRITHVEPGTVTLMLRGRKQRRWGFYLPTGWCDWEEYDYATRRPCAVVSDRSEERIATPNGGMGA